MRYHCVQCDEQFELAGGEEKPRCPKCLRTHGLRPIESRSPRRNAPARGVPVALAGLAIVLGLGGYWWWSRSQAAGKDAAGVLDGDDLRAQVQASAGADVGDAASLLEPDDALRAFAEAAARGKDSDEAKLRAVVGAIKARADKQAFVPWSLLEPRETPALTAAQTFAKLKQDGARNQLYPLEVAAVAVAALRGIDVTARVIELHAFAGERSPLDPSGRFGYYGVGLSAQAAQPKGKELVLDVYGGRSAEPKRGDYAALDDKQAVAALLGLRAMQRLAHANDPASALSLADAATKLAPSAANLRGVRAAVLLASGGKDEGTRELEAAAQLQPGPAQHNNLAVFALATGDAERAAKEVARALAKTPDFASAHLTLASVHMARAESDLARGELEQAERLDPGLPSLPLAWAELYAGTGDLMQAQAKAEEGIRLRPKAPESHLLLARILRQAGRYDDMRREAQKVLELAAPSQRDQVTEVIKAVLGPTALGTTPGDDEGDPALPRLRQPSQDPGTLQLGSGEPKLRLGDDTDSKLKLDLTH
jgi:tetratricopeptide (TPR) repeat protein